MINWQVFVTANTSYSSHALLGVSFLHPKIFLSELHTIMIELFGI